MDSPASPRRRSVRARLEGKAHAGAWIPVIQWTLFEKQIGAALLLGPIEQYIGHIGKRHAPQRLGKAADLRHRG